MLAGEQHRLAGDFFTELGKGDHAAGKGHPADKGGERGDNPDKHSQLRVLVVFTPGEEQAGQAAEAVEQGDHLRHLGHSHLEGKEEPDGRTNDDAHQNPFVVKTLGEQGHHHGEEHAHRGHQVALPGGGRRAEHLQAEDKKDGGEDIGKIDGNVNGTHFAPPFSFFLNISSIRLVTT